VAFERLPRAGRRADVAALLSVAERQTGLSDFGDDRFLEPMAFLLKSIEREAKLNALGRLVFYQHAVQLLCNRLYLERDRQTDSRISGRNIPKPVFITGLPRTGTTLLHGLLAQDYDSRAKRQPQIRSQVRKTPTIGLKSYRQLTRNNAKLYPSKI
jgi:Sulfotransferase family